MEPQDYLVTFERIGRTRDVPPLTVRAAGTADSVAHQVYTYARPYLLSSGVEVRVNLDEKRGAIYAGFHNAGTFTVEAIEGATDA